MTAPETAATPGVGLFPCGTPNADSTPVVEGAGTAEAGIINVELTDIAYVHTGLTIPANTDVTLRFTNNGLADHSFKIEARRATPASSRRRYGRSDRQPAGRHLHLLPHRSGPPGGRHGRDADGRVIERDRAAALSPSLPVPKRRARYLHSGGRRALVVRVVRSLVIPRVS